MAKRKTKEEKDAEEQAAALVEGEGGESVGDGEAEEAGPVVDDDGDEVTAETHIRIEDGPYVKSSEPRAYRQSIGGRNYEHVSDDPTGCWVYRPM